MIIDWQGNGYYDGLSHAFVPPGQLGAPQDTAYALIYDPFLFLHVQFAQRLGEAGLASGYTLVYDPFLFLWVQYASTLEPLATVGTFRADGAGLCQFTANERDFLWLAEGFAGATWQLFVNEVAGFRADGTGTCEFLAAGSVLRTDGQGSARFDGATYATPTGFQADGGSDCRFLSEYGVAEECLTPPDTPIAGSIPNFVY